MIETSNNGVFQSINAKCANCVSNFKHENERNIVMNITSDPPGKTNEIDITDAIFYIYGLTVADWSKALDLDFESDLSSASAFVFAHGIPFCCECASALKNVYTSHKTLKELSHNESLFAKALNSKPFVEAEIKTEKNTENEVSSIDEKEIKEEINSEDGFHEFEESTLEESFQLNDTLEGSSDNLQSKSLLCNILLNTKEGDSGTFPVERNENVSSGKVQQKEGSGSQLRLKRKRRKRTFTLAQRKRPKVSKKKSLSAVQKSCEESSVTSANQTINEVKQNLKECSLKKNRMTIHSSQHPFSILCCDKSFNTLSKFLYHKDELHEKNDELSLKLAKCCTCEILIPIESVRKHHLKLYEQLRIKYFSCKPCGITFRKASDLTEHYKTHDPNYKTVLCDICEAPMESDVLQIVHKVKQHPETTDLDTPYHCNKCDDKFSDIRRFKSHHETHDRKTCNVCGIEFLRHRTLIRHLNKIHRAQVNFKYFCEICNSGFNNETFFARHKEKDCDPQKRRFVCEKCAKTFLTTTQWRSHMKIHEDIECPNKELFRCTQCGKLMKHSQGLRKHERAQHPVTPKLFYCEKCGKTTKNRTNMRIHMKVHERDTE